MASAMDIDDEASDLPTSSSGKGDKKRFEVKKVTFTIKIQFYYKRSITNPFKYCKKTS